MSQEKAFVIEFIRQSVYKRPHPSVKTARATVKTFIVDPLRPLIGLLQVQNDAFVMLRVIRKGEFPNKLRDQRLALRPKPTSAKVDSTAACTGRREDPAPQSITRLENGELAAPSLQISRQRQAAQTAADDRHIQHV
jgi:hypothetical protein